MTSYAKLPDWLVDSKAPENKDDGSELPKPVQLKREIMADEEEELRKKMRLENEPQKKASFVVQQVLQSRGLDITEPREKIDLRPHKVKINKVAIDNRKITTEKSQAKVVSDISLPFYFELVWKIGSQYLAVAVADATGKKILLGDLCGDDCKVDKKFLQLPLTVQGTLSDSTAMKESGVIEKKLVFELIGIQESTKATMRKLGMGSCTHFKDNESKLAHILTKDVEVWEELPTFILSRLINGKTRSKRSSEKKKLLADDDVNVTKQVLTKLGQALLQAAKAL